MVIPGENRKSIVHYAPPDADEIEELQELNLLLLIHLRAAAREGASGFGLAPSLARKLCDFPMSTLESIAEFPRALFVIDLDNISITGEHQIPDPIESSRRSLALTVLYSAWNMSRRRDFQARLFLRLSARTLRRLRTTALSELPLIATSPSLIHCDFAGSESIWRSLILQEDFELTRALRLVALHPDVDLQKSTRILSLNTPTA
jgi:hypothetical protein